MKKRVLVYIVVLASLGTSINYANVLIPRIAIQQTGMIVLLIPIVGIETIIYLLGKNIDYRRRKQLLFTTLGANIFSSLIGVVLLPVLLLLVTPSHLPVPPYPTSTFQAIMRGITDPLYTFNNMGQTEYPQFASLAATIAAGQVVVIACILSILLEQWILKKRFSVLTRWQIIGAHILSYIFLVRTLIDFGPELLYYIDKYI